MVQVQRSRRICSRGIIVVRLQIPGKAKPLRRFRAGATGFDPPGEPKRRYPRMDVAETAIDPKTKFRCLWIEGYCLHTSIQAGETLQIFVSTNPAASRR
jgi:hypothetical protein